MSKNKIYNLILLLSELIIYIIFLFFSKGRITSYLQYASLVILFLWLISKKNKDDDTYLVGLAFVFTLIADYFLVIMNGQKELALVSFIITQIIYAYRLYRFDSSKKVVNISIRLFLMLVLTSLAYIITKDKFDLLIFLTMIYFANLITNFIITFVCKNINWYFAIGLFFFICCDIVVGLNNISDYISISSGSIIYDIISAPIDYTWAFYLPSQILIAFSIKQKRTTDC